MHQYFLSLSLPLSQSLVRQNEEILSTMEGFKHREATPAEAPMPPEEERLILNVVVVGASVAGTSCAYGLRYHGHEVRIIEKGSGIYQVRP